MSLPYGWRKDNAPITVTLGPAASAFVRAMYTGYEETAVNDMVLRELYDYEEAENE